MPDQLIRDIMVDRLQTISRQFYWNLIRRQDREEETEVLLSLNASAMDRVQRKVEVDRLVTIVEPFGWDDTNVRYSDTTIELTLVKKAEEEEEPSIEIEGSRE